MTDHTKRAEATGMTSSDKGVTVTQEDRELIAALFMTRPDCVEEQRPAACLAAARHRQSAQADAVEIVREYEALMERGFADRRDVERVRNLGRNFLARGGEG